MKNVIKEFNVHSGVTAAFLESTLTEDISTVESIYDLIDNSIDAARTSILDKKQEIDFYGLPADYSGYNILIRIDKNSIRILDNCSGIDESTIRDGMFVVAKRSSHAYGIGHYGIGLKRSLLKLGNKYAMISDNSQYSFKMNFVNNQIGHNDNNLRATQIISTGRNKALFSISDLKNEVRYDISNEMWFDNFINGISERYAVFIKKGLSIKVVNTLKSITKNIDSSIPGIRENALVMPFKQKIKMGDVVDVFIESGIHEDYLFPGETNHSVGKSRALTEQFGLYFTCNDRIIISASTSKEHGWGDAKWHSEYNGFVCWIKFVSRSPGKLPWNTAKTGLRLDSTMFLQIKEIIEPITKNYRKEIKERYLKKKKSATIPLVITKPITPEKKPHIDPDAPSNNNQKPTNDGKDSKNEKNSQLNKVRGIDHPESWKTLLPSHFPSSGDDILDAFIKEAKSIVMSDASHAAAMLYRAIMEASSLYFIRKNNKVTDVKNLYFLTEGKRKALSDEQKELMDVSLDMMIKWFKANGNIIFSSSERKLLNLSLRHLDNHKSYINGVVHCNQIITSEKLIPIRNDTYKFLEFLVKNRN